MNLLHRSYPRFSATPLNLEAEDLLAAVVERLLKALREARPRNRAAILRLGQSAYPLGIE